MRLFISVNLSDEIQDALTDVQDAMMDAGIWGNYTMPENMHITLAFIGVFDDPDRVLDVLDSISFTPFEIKLNYHLTDEDVKIILAGGRLNLK